MSMSKLNFKGKKPVREEEAKERPYICVHTKKGKCNVTATSSYGAAKKAAEKWKLKDTAGIDVHLADVTHTAVNEKKDDIKNKGKIMSKKTVKESGDYKLSAARLEGKSHGLKGHAYCGKNYEDREYARSYHEGYVDGLNEANGMGIYEETLMPQGGTSTAAPPASVPGMASAATPSAMKAPSAPSTPSIMNDSIFAFEALDKQLNDLLNEAKKKEDKKEKEEISKDDKKKKSKVNEGVTITVSKGNEGASDSVNISATDADSDAILQLVKNSGIAGMFSGTETTGSGIEGGTEIMPSKSSQHGGIEVVGDHEGMLGMMRKLSGIEGGSSQAPAAGPEDGMSNAEGPEMSGPEEVREVESEDEQAFGGAEAGFEDPMGSSTDDQAIASFRSIGAGQSGPEAMPQEPALPEQPEAEIDPQELGDKIAQFLLSLDDVAANAGIEVPGEETEAEPETDDASDDAPDFGGSDDTSDDSSEDDTADDTSDDSAEDDSEDEEVAEDNAPDSDAEETEADEETEAEEDKALAEGKKKKKFELFKKKGDKTKKEDDDKEEKLEEWANNAGKKGTDAQFEQDIDFMQRVISGGLNKPKSTGQTTVPVQKGQKERTMDTERSEALNEWLKLAGVRK